MTPHSVVATSVPSPFLGLEDQTKNHCKLVICTVNWLNHPQIVVFFMGFMALNAYQIRTC